MNYNPVESPLPPAALLAPVALQGQSSQSTRMKREDVVRTTLAVFFMAALAAAALWVMSPFIPALIWATMLVVATWPLMLRVQAYLGRRRWLAVTVMTTVFVLAFVIPASIAVVKIVENADDVPGWVQSIRETRLPPAPGWLEAVPVLGTRASKAWNEFVAAGPGELTRRLEPHARDVASWVVSQLGNVGLIFIQTMLTIILSAILFARGETAAAGVIAFFRRLAGTHGENVVVLAGHAIRSVALGVVVTALVQSVLGGIGLAIAGVPFAGMLTALMFVLAVAQIGAGPVLIGAVIWMYWTSESAWASTALLVWCLFVGSIDNVLRPILIQRGGELPLIIVFAGVVGGLLTLGVIGIFLGPVVLAVVYTLLKAWVNETA
jgi:predicted PurR-regulated permease PerM